MLRRYEPGRGGEASPPEQHDSQLCYDRNSPLRLRPCLERDRQRSDTAMASPLCGHDKRARFRDCTLHRRSCWARNAFNCVDRTHLWHWNLLRERARRYLRGFGSQDFIVQHDPLCRAWSDRLHDDTVDCSRVLSDACEIRSSAPPQTRPRFDKLNRICRDSSEICGGPAGSSTPDPSAETFSNRLQVSPMGRSSLGWLRPIQPPPPAQN